MLASKFQLPGHLPKQHGAVKSIAPLSVYTQILAFVMSRAQEQESYADLDADTIRRMSVKQLQKLMSDNGMTFHRRDKKDKMIALALDFFQLEDDESDDDGEQADAELGSVHAVLASGSASAAVAAVEGLPAAGGNEGAADSVEDAWCVADIDAEIALIQKMHLVETTRVSYKRCQKKFYEFIEVHHPEVQLHDTRGIADVASLPSLVFKEFIMNACRKRNKAGEVVKNPKTQKPMLIAF